MATKVEFGDKEIFADSEIDENGLMFMKQFKSIIKRSQRIIPMDRVLGYGYKIKQTTYSLQKSCRIMPTDYTGIGDDTKQKPGRFIMFSSGDVR